MSWVVLVRAKAERDWEAARDWDERKVPGLGASFWMNSPPRCARWN